MLGDVGDFVRRMLVVLPSRWFANQAVPPSQPTVLQGLLAGFGTAWAAIFTLISTVQLQSRLATVSGPFLDMAGADFFGNDLPRRPQESDAAFRLRIQQELLRPRGTRAALVLALTELTGKTPVIFEPERPADTGGYTVGGVGYSIGGGYGNLNLPYQAFVMAFRPAGQGIANFAGYGTGGVLFYGDLAMVATPVPDTGIYAEVTNILPAGYIGWTCITG